MSLNLSRPPQDGLHGSKPCRNALHFLVKNPYIINFLKPLLTSPQMVIMGLDHAAWSSTYKSSQWILQHYQKQGVVPQKKLFTSGERVSACTAPLLCQKSMACFNNKRDCVNVMMFSSVVTSAQSWYCFYLQGLTNQPVLDLHTPCSSLSHACLLLPGPATLKILFEFRAADSQVHSGTIRPHNTQGMPANHPEVEKLRSSHAVHEPSEFRNRSGE